MTTRYPTVAVKPRKTWCGIDCKGDPRTMEVGTMPVSENTYGVDDMVSYAMTTNEKIEYWLHTLNNLSLEEVETQETADQICEFISALGRPVFTDPAHAYSAAHSRYVGAHYQNNQTAFEHSELLRHRQNVIDILEFLA